MNQEQILQTLCQNILSIQSKSPILVGIDGAGASGKTMLADSLVKPLEKQGKSVIRSSVDNFHNPSHVRKQRGELCPVGYYEDSFNYQAMKDSLLEPLSSNGNGLYSTGNFDFRTNSEVSSSIKKAHPHTVLIFEGVFLFRPELVDYWDYRIFVHSDFNITLNRALKRDLNLFGTEEIVKEKYYKRYIPGQQLYLDKCKPQCLAHITIDNNDYSAPKIIT
jgi:uridine kinase